MTTRPPPHPTSTFTASQSPNQTFPSLPAFSNMSRPSFSLHSNTPPTLWDSIDASTIEVVDLTGTSPSHPTRRRSTPPTTKRPSKRSKRNDTDAYIFLDDEEEQEQEQETPSSSSKTNVRHKSPLQSGSLSQAKCVICLDSPTDLAATPCGHLFCDFCIRSALKVGHPARGRGAAATYSGSCPICRRKFTTKNLIPLEIKVRTLG